MESCAWVVRLLDQACIAGERNCWGDLLSTWMNVPAVSVRAVAVFASGGPDETL